MVTAPQWKWEWNLNTLVILFGFLAGIAAWGGTWQKVTDAVERGAIRAERLDARLSAMEQQTRRFDNHELRIANLERQATDATSAMKAVESTLNSLAADMRVTREILQRIEASQNGRRPP